MIRLLLIVMMLLLLLTSRKQAFVFLIHNILIKQGRIGRAPEEVSK